MNVTGSIPPTIAPTEIEPWLILSEPDPPDPPDPSDPLLVDGAAKIKYYIEKYEGKWWISLWHCN